MHHLCVYVNQTNLLLDFILPQRHERKIKEEQFLIDSTVFSSHITSNVLVKKNGDIWGTTFDLEPESKIHELLASRMKT
jgi:hypothetical protein